MDAKSQHSKLHRGMLCEHYKPCGPRVFDKFIKDMPRYSREEPLKRVPLEYHSEIEVFMKRNADTLPEHRDHNHKLNLVEGKEAPFLQNYKPLSDQEQDAMKKC